MYKRQNLNPSPSPSPGPNQAWQRKYGKPLRAMIRSECSGDYKRLAIAWVTVPDELEVTLRNPNPNHNPNPNCIKRR